MNRKKELLRDMRMILGEYGNDEVMDVTGQPLDEIGLHVFRLGLLYQLNLRVRAESDQVYTALRALQGEDEEELYGQLEEVEEEFKEVGADETDPH